MKRRPQPGSKRAISFARPLSTEIEGDLGLVLSGGGARAAYQVGALRALVPHLQNASLPISTILGSSIGAINGLVLSACLKSGVMEAVAELEDIWRERTFRTTFKGSPSKAFMKAIRVAGSQYLSPGPRSSDDAIFDPTPLHQRVDGVIRHYGGLRPEERVPYLANLGVMTTIEGEQRRPLLFLSSHKRIEGEAARGASFDVCYVDNLTAKHGFASAALPSVLPPVELDTEHGKVRLVDGGISQNLPVDPAVRLGVHRVILLDVSGRDWWFDRYGEAHDTRPEWEVPCGPDTFCLRPPDVFIARCIKPLGPLLKEAVGSSTKQFMASVGPVWPLFTLLKKKLGEDVAYEVMSYIALDRDYVNGLIERGFHETSFLLRRDHELRFHQAELSRVAS